MSISVCIPTYNQGKYIEQCVRSVIAQSVKPDEIIVSDDCSTDNTNSILNKLQIEIPILKVVRQNQNLGMVKNTNYCLQLAQSEIIVKLDSDDYLLPKYIETLSGLLYKYPEAGYAHGAVQEVDNNNNRGKIRNLFRRTGFQSSEDSLKSSCKGYQVAANIIMFKKSALDAVGYITSNVKFAEDFYLSVEIANAGFGNVYSEEVLSCYRVWADEGNVRQKRKLNEINGIRIIFDEPLKKSFSKRGWDLGVLENKKKNFACRQSDCLTWNIYNNEEKDELQSAILNLSSSPKVRLYVSLYRSGFGNLIIIPSKIVGRAKHVIKKILVSK